MCDPASWLLCGTCYYVCKRCVHRFYWARVDITGAAGTPFWFRSWKFGRVKDMARNKAAEYPKNTKIDITYYRATRRGDLRRRRIQKSKRWVKDEGWWKDMSSARLVTATGGVHEDSDADSDSDDVPSGGDDSDSDDASVPRAELLRRA